MSTSIERPVFFENQILGAADLTATVDLSRGQQARHNRYLHIWGIAAGLELKGEPHKEKKAPFLTITLSPGVAIDGTGREIIVPASSTLSEATFSQLGVARGQPTQAPNEADRPWFPVFLVGRDERAPQPALSTGSCDNSSPTRVSEGYEITFGRPGDERKAQDEVDFSEGPGKGGWKILLGFVRWDDPQNAFNGLTSENNGVGRKYAGVQADEVAARGGSLELRTRTKPENKKPALFIDETEDGQLRFGSLDAQGQLKAVFTVNAKGDVIAEGKISSAVAPGSVQVQSGIAMDGLLLPLPPGIDPADIDSGKFTLHFHVSPRITQTDAPTASSTWGAIPIECFVDANRRINCRVHWQPLVGVDPAVSLAAFCDYVVMVSVPATSGNTP